MKMPFSRIFNSQSKKIPGVITGQLNVGFPNAKNVDWEIKGETYEAIFYLNDVEHIAKFSKTGELIEYKKNLWLDELPEEVKIAGNAFGEIMNGIVIHRGDEILYELIIRNEKLDRFEYLISKEGIVLKSKPL